MHLETSSHPYAPFQKARFARAANACLFGTLSLTLKPLILESSVRYPYWQSNTFGFMERRDSGNRKSGSPHTVLCPSERMSDSLTPCALRKSESTESCPAPSWVKQPESFRLSVMLLKNLLTESGEYTFTLPVSALPAAYLSPLLLVFLCQPIQRDQLSP